MDPLEKATIELEGWTEVARRRRDIDGIAEALAKASAAKAKIERMAPEGVQVWPRVTASPGVRHS